MSNNTSNNNPITSIISQAMKDAQTQSNRLASLMVAVFQSEATFSNDAILQIMRKEGADRTEAVNGILIQLSDDFAKTLDNYERRIDKDYKASLGKGSKEHEANAFEIEALRKKLNAARIMITRAMQGVYHLRKNRCSKLSVHSAGAGVLVARMTGKLDTEDAYPQRVTSTAIMTAGDNDIRVALGKKTAAKEPTAKNPVGNSIADGAKSLAAVLTSLGASGERKPLTDYDDNVEKDMETVMREVFIAKFYDGGTFDKPTFDEWLKMVNTFAAARPQRKPGDVAPIGETKVA